MPCIKIEVWVTVDDVKDAEEIAHDIHEILNNNGITNIADVTNDICD